MIIKARSKKKLKVKSARETGDKILMRGNSF